IEAEGMRRSRMRAESADLKLVVLDARAWRSTATDVLALCDWRSLVLLNKRDLLPEPGRDGIVASIAAAAPQELRDAAASGRLRSLSAKGGEGVAELLAALGQMAEEAMGAGADGLVTRLRHRQALEDCLAALGRAQAATAVELAAEDLRLALRALGRIAGRVDVEDVLDVIFRDFCIGK
ncbi:MAG: tRNA uridine-5-carboxymethylaminomethyl(34) synthesis GTPase MnmE, partial [Kiloniellales bacterium]